MEILVLGENMSKFDLDSLGNILIKVNGEIIFKLQEVLDDRKISKYKLSRITNIGYETICNYCKGKVSLINVEYLKIFCNVLDCSISDIIEYKN